MPGGYPCSECPIARPELSTLLHRRERLDFLIHLAGGLPGLLRLEPDHLKALRGLRHKRAPERLSHNDRPRHMERMVVCPAGAPLNTAPTGLVEVRRRLCGDSRSKTQVPALPDGHLTCP